MTGSALPILDIAAFAADPGSADARAFVHELRETAHQVGFFYLVGHGVPQEAAGRLQAAARAFFRLPEADRLAIENTRSAQFRGYTPYGNERTNGQADLREQIDICREEEVRWPGPGEPAWQRLHGPNLWPQALPELRPLAVDWMARLERLGHTLTHAMALALGQPVDRLDGVVTPAWLHLKLIRYLPAAHSTPQGVGSHRDEGFLTFVYQDGVSGLQVERDGRLIDVAPIEGSLVVNIGEMLQLLTRGYFRATVHRVVSPPPGNERISLSYFFNPKLEATLRPLDLPAELAAQAPGGASSDPANPILDSYGANTLKVRLRAHPNVAAIHHADLLDPRGA